MTSRFEVALLANPRAVEVPIDQAGIVFFQQRPGIGTRDLNACTVTIILSPYAAILAHIAPNNPTAAAAGQPGEIHVYKIMQKAFNLLTQYHTYFPYQSTSCIISASPDQGATISLLDQRNYITDLLQQHNLSVSSTTYHIPSDQMGPAGHIVYLERMSNKTTLYIADIARYQW